MDVKVLFRNEGSGLYTHEQLAEIERVIHAFYNYLRDSRTCELVWSDKVGYLFFTIGGGKRRGPVSAKVIRDADELVRALLEEVSRDVRSETRLGRFFHRQRPELRERVSEYMDHLPEYRDRVAAGSVR